MCEKVEPGSLVPEVDDKGYLNDEAPSRRIAVLCCCMSFGALLCLDFVQYRRRLGSNSISEFEPSVFLRGKNKKMTKFYLKNLEKSAR